MIYKTKEKTEELEEKPLSKYCEDCGGLYRYIGDTLYCGIGLVRKVNCEYQDDYKDDRGLYRCLNPVYIEEVEDYERRIRTESIRFS